MIQEHIAKVKTEEIDIVEETKKVLEKLKELNKEYTFMSVISDNLALECAKNVKEQIKNNKENNNKSDFKLAGVFVTIKDCVCVKDVESTASSQILKGYNPVFDATVVQKLKEQGAIIVGKTIQDEFGFGSFSVNKGLCYDTPKNPVDKERAAGGSSGGCAVATRLCIEHNIPHISIAESTGGSIENPASFCGVIGFCPTYGRVSRYGLLSYANSLDKIGVMAETIDETAVAFEVISGEDEKDSTSLPKSEYKEHSTSKKEQLTIGVITETMNDSVHPQIRSAINQVTENLTKKGHIIKQVSLPYTKEFGISTYYIIGMSEASTNLAALCGLRYGIQDVRKDEHFSTYFTRMRSENFGEEVKRRIMLGTFMRMAGYRDAFYIKAAKSRTKIIEEYKEKFKDCDILISPTMPFVAPKFEEISKLRPVDHYLSDIMTIGPNLAGIPHMSFPIAEGEKTKMPIGMMVMSDHNKEDVLFQFGIILESLKNAKTIGGNAQ